MSLVLKLKFFTPKALHNLPQGITLGLSIFIHRYAESVEYPLNNEIVKPFPGYGPACLISRRGMPG